MTSRLFIALKLPNEIIDQIISVRKTIYDKKNNYKWESEDKLHITLKFLGDVKEDTQKKVELILQETVTGSKKIELELKNFLTLKRNGKPSLIWLNLEESAVLSRLVEKIEENLEPLGFKKENRKFKPHVTIIRLKGYEDKTLIKNFTSREPLNVKFSSDEIALLKSELRPDRSYYEQVKKFKLI